MGLDMSDRNIYINRNIYIYIYIYICDEARNRIHARNGEKEETTEVVSSPLLVYINLLALLYVLQT